MFNCYRLNILGVHNIIYKKKVIRKPKPSKIIYIFK